MRRSRKRGKAKQNKKLIWLAIAVLVVGIGFAALQKYLNINGNASIDSNFDVRISNITKGEVVGEAYEKEDATYTDTTATFNVGLKNVGDSLTYEVKVSNIGNTNAKLESIDVSEEGSSNISYEVTGISEGDIINSEAEKTVYVKTTYSGDESEASEKTLTVTLLFKQAANSVPVVKNYEVGEEITLGTEHFYVIEDNGDTVTALAKYNLLVGKYGDYNANEGWTIRDIPVNSSNYGIQSSLATGDMHYTQNDTREKGDYYGILDDLTDNEINGFISEYQSYLNGQPNVSNVIVSIPSYEKYQSLGFITDVNLRLLNPYPWLNSTSYRLSDSFTDDYGTWHYAVVINEDRVVGSAFGYDGLRPVITVAKSVID